MSGIIGFVFVLTMCNCIAGLIDQTRQAIRRRRNR